MMSTTFQAAILLRKITACCLVVLHYLVKKYPRWLKDELQLLVGNMITTINHKGKDPIE